MEWTSVRAQVQEVHGCVCMAVHTCAGFLAAKLGESLQCIGLVIHWLHHHTSAASFSAWSL